jgi:Tol biopolymer transport system component
VSVDSAGAQGNADCLLAAMSADGRFVVFGSRSTNLVPGDANGHYDIFLRDRLTGTTERVSVASTGTEGNGDSLESSVSEDGRYVAFSSSATDLVTGDTNGCVDVFLRDRVAGTTVRISVGDAYSENP